MLERCAELVDLIVDLLQAARVHAILDLGVGEGLLHRDEREGSALGGALDLALRAREGGDGLIELNPAGMQLIGRGLESEDIARGDLGCGALLVELTVDVGELLKRATPLMLGTGERAAHLGKTGHHVAALFLKQSHVRPDSADNVLHMAALLAQVTDEQALLLEHDLQLLQLALLLAQSVAGELRPDSADNVLHMAALLAQVTDEQALLLEHDLQLLQLALLLAQSVAGELQRGGALT